MKQLAMVPLSACNCYSNWGVSTAKIKKKQPPDDKIDRRRRCSHEVVLAFPFCQGEVAPITNHHERNLPPNFRVHYRRIYTATADPPDFYLLERRRIPSHPSKAILMISCHSCAYFAILPTKSTKRKFRSSTRHVSFWNALVWRNSPRRV